MRIMRSGGKSERGSCPSQVVHCVAVGGSDSRIGRSGRSARTSNNSFCSHGCKTTFGALVTPLPRTSPVAGRNKVSNLPVPPGLASLRDGLVRTCLILAPHGDPYDFSHSVGKFDEPLFTSVCGSTTVTTPALRFRCAVPVGHHVRVRWYELPASCSTRRIVLVPTFG